MSECALSRIVAAERNSLAAINECKSLRQQARVDAEKIGLMQRQIVQQQQAISALQQQVALIRHGG